jgi:poly(3-hydroxybutyrate) depolymerase
MGSGGGGMGSGGGGMGSGGESGSDEVPSMGCGTAPTLTSGQHTIQVGGQDRSFMLRIPDNYDDSHPHRLVFAFHWNGGTMNDVDGGGSSGYSWSYYGLREQAEDSTIFVAPQGISNGWANSNGRDLDFVDEMVSQIKEDLCVDESRLFSMGFSYGGGMTYGIACDRADVFRAAAVYSGAQLSGCNDGSKPIAYLGIHGISDSTCIIAGGRSLRDRFVGNNGCQSQTPAEPSGGSNTHVCTSYDGCSDGRPVRWCAFDGGHTPGPVEGGGDDGALTWTKKEAWQFFSQF